MVYKLNLSLLEQGRQELHGFVHGTRRHCLPIWPGSRCPRRVGPGDRRASRTTRTGSALRGGKRTSRPRRRPRRRRPCSPSPSRRRRQGRPVGPRRLRATRSTPPGSGRTLKGGGGGVTKGVGSGSGALKHGTCENGRRRRRRRRRIVNVDFGIAVVWTEKRFYSRDGVADGGPGRGPEDGEGDFDPVHGVEELRVEGLPQPEARVRGPR
jgi:hypothetical protein